MLYIYLHGKSLESLIFFHLPANTVSIIIFTGNMVNFWIQTNIM